MRLTREIFSRKEALKIAQEILENAEKERLKSVEDEAKRESCWDND